MSRDTELEALAETYRKMTKNEALALPDRMWAKNVLGEITAILATPSPGTLHGELRADSVDALWCMTCGYRRGTSSGQTRIKCPHGHGELVRARLLTLEDFAKLTQAALASHPAPAPATREAVAWLVCDNQGKEPGEPVPQWAMERADRILALIDGGGLREAAVKLREATRKLDSKNTPVEILDEIFKAEGELDEALARTPPQNDPWKNDPDDDFKGMYGTSSPNLSEGTPSAPVEKGVSP